MIKHAFITAKAALRQMKSKKGQTLVEYALILAFIAVVAIAVLVALGGGVTGIFGTVNTALSTSPTSH